MQDVGLTWQIVVGLLLFTGAFLTFLGSLGLVKLPDYYSRLHPPAKNTTVGLGCILLASALFFSFGVSPEAAGLTLREFLITIFLFLTAPVSAHIMGKTALHLDAEFIDRHADDEAEGEVFHPSERRQND